MNVEYKSQELYDKFNVDTDSDDSDDDSDLADFIIDDIEDYYKDDDYESDTDDESDTDRESDTDDETYMEIDEE